ncbi:ParB/RepB/Spo0J family partition protein [Sedimentitalea sp. HM32M-2]|uniref:ParB/RepB/Spo0J family partition protein n=1 Tax=Sedimentitalea sp. HM32M-2 TaxID=3351566 RepID=UPI0036303430
MAKRKRLTPAQPGFLQAEPARAAPGAAPIAPIAQVAGEASANAALGELSETLRTARAQGRLIETLPLAAIDETHLVRDRMVQDADEMAALEASLQARGQQSPIEVVALPADKPGKGGAAYGLISGWRRLSALRRLQARTGEDRFATVEARLITPADAQAAYVAMVEENEIRAGLSLYEKGRIALRSVHEGVYPTPRAALRGLFGSVSRSRRSKIGSFLTLVEPLDGLLRFPAAIPEKLGLALAKALQDDHRFATALRLRLRQQEPDSAEAELALLAAALRDRDQAASAAANPSPATDPSPAPNPAPATAPARDAARPRLTGLDAGSVADRLQETRVTARLDAAAQRIELTGGGVDAALFAALQDWLKTR